MMWNSIERDSVVECMQALALGGSADDECEAGEENCLFGGREERGVLVQNAVQRSAQLGHWRLVALLLLWGANSESLDTSGCNLVHYIAAIPDSSVSVLLSVLRKNPSLGACEDQQNRTPLQYAEECANGPVATIIRIFQAQIDEKAAVPQSPQEEKTSSLIERVLHFKGPFKRKNK